MISTNEFYLRQKDYFLHSIKCSFELEAQVRLAVDHIPKKKYLNY